MDSHCQGVYLLWGCPYAFWVKLKFKVKKLRLKFGSWLSSVLIAQIHLFFGLLKSNKILITGNYYKAFYLS